MQLAFRFKALYQSLGMDLPACAKYLHVTERTLHNWMAGKHDIPFAAYKLLRLLNRMDLPGQAWAGWSFYDGKLWSPEGRARSIQWMRLGGDCWCGVQAPSKHYVAGVHEAVRARPQAKAKPRQRPGASRRVPRLRPWDGAKRRP